MLVDAARLALRLGTNNDLNPLTQDDAYERQLGIWQFFLVAAKRITPAQRTVMMAGPARSSAAIARLGYKAGLKYLRGVNPAFAKDDPLIPDDNGAELYYLGSELIREAESCLNSELLGLADQWHEADPKGRIELLSVLYAALKLINRGELLTARSDRLRKTPASRDLIAALEVLPRCFGSYEHSVLRPNCLGMSMLLTAWCKRAGATFIYCNTIVDRETGLRKLWRQADEIILKWCDEHEIDIPPNPLSDLRSDLDRLTADTETQDSFHHCVMVQIAPGDWVIVDPYLQVFERIDQLDRQGDVDLDRVKATLEDHRFTTPGLTLAVRLDSYRWCREHFTFTFRDALVEANVLKRIAQEAGDDPVALIAKIFVSADEGYLDYSATAVSNFLMSMYHRFGEVPPVMSELGWWTAVSILNSNELYTDKALKRYRVDPYFRMRAHEALIFFPVLNELDKIRQLGDKGHQPAHFSVEAGIPELQIGAMVLNHLAVWDDEAAALLDLSGVAGHTGSQLAWHDAVARTYKEKGEEGLATGTAATLLGYLSQMPDDLLHVLNTDLLAQFMGEGEETDDGQR